MKKFIPILILIISISFVACKKDNLNEKTFEKYFPNCSYTNNHTSDTCKTQDFFDNKQSVYSTIQFNADPDWSNNLYLDYLIINFSAIESKNVDMICLLYTNKTKNEYPITVEFKDKMQTQIKVPINTTLNDETYLSIYLSTPGGNGYDGTIFDSTNVANGFVWKIEDIKLFASH